MTTILYSINKNWSIVSDLDLVINKKKSIIFDDKNLELWKKIILYFLKNDLVLYDVIGVSWLLYFHVTKIKIISSFRWQSIVSILTL